MKHKLYFFAALLISILLVYLASCTDHSSLGPLEDDSSSSAVDKTILVNLTPSSGSLVPTFSGTTEDYSLSVANNISNITFSPEAAAVWLNDISITVDGSLVASGAASQAISLDEGVPRMVHILVSWTNIGIVRSYTITVTRMGTAAKDITAFSIGGAAGVIGSNTITVNTPYSLDLTNAVADFTITGLRVEVGGTLQISSFTENDFSSPVIYTVYASDGSSKDYTVSAVPQAAATGSAMLSFDLYRSNNTFLGADYTSTLSNTNFQVIIPYNARLTNLIPDITISPYASIVPDNKQPVDFVLDVPLSYVVTAEDGSSSSYSVTVSYEPSPKKILSFILTELDPDVVGIINESSNTISLTVPYGTVIGTFSPAISIDGLSVNPASNAAQTFTEGVPQTYTVTPVDGGSTRDYDVTIYRGPASTGNQMLSMSLPAASNVALSVDEEALMYTSNALIRVPDGTDLSAIVPVIGVSQYATVIPAAGQAVTFTNKVPQLYHVISESGDTNIYFVTIMLEAPAVFYHSCNAFDDAAGTPSAGMSAANNTNGMKGGAIHFDAVSNAYIGFTLPGTLGEYSVSWWQNNELTEVNRKIIGNADNTSFIGYRNDAAQLVPRASYNEIVIYSSGNPSGSGWKHMVLTRDHTSHYYLYEDGVLIGNAKATKTVAEKQATFSVIGAGSPGLIETYMQGSLDEIYIYDYIIDMEQISNHLNDID